jgi:hypothetical protein
LERIARTVIDANNYMTLATADDAGRPWASPVRLYRAKVSEHSVLVEGGDPEFGRGVDTRLVVTCDRTPQAAVTDDQRSSSARRLRRSTSSSVGVSKANEPRSTPPARL